MNLGPCITARMIGSRSAIRWPPSSLRTVVVLGSGRLNELRAWRGRFLHHGESITRAQKKAYLVSGTATSVASPRSRSCAIRSQAAARAVALAFHVGSATRVHRRFHRTYGGISRASTSTNEDARPKGKGEPKPAPCKRPSLGPRRGVGARGDNLPCPVTRSNARNCRSGVWQAFRRRRWT